MQQSRGSFAIAKLLLSYVMQKSHCRTRINSCQYVLSEDAKLIFPHCHCYCFLLMPACCVTVLKLDYNGLNICCRMSQSLHEELSFEGTSAYSHWWVNWLNVYCRCNGIHLCTPAAKHVKSRWLTSLYRCWVDSEFVTSVMFSHSHVVSALFLTSRTCAFIK